MCRRLSEEVGRLYQCRWEGCVKGYASLSNLNTHVSMNGHGHQRALNEFIKIRKEQRDGQNEEYDKCLTEEAKSRFKGKGEINPLVRGVAEPERPFTDAPYDGYGRPSHPQLRQPMANQQSDYMPTTDLIHTPSSIGTAGFESEHRYTPSGYPNAPRNGGRQPEKVVNMLHYAFGGYSTPSLQLLQPDQLFTGWRRDSINKCHNTTCMNDEKVTNILQYAFGGYSTPSLEPLQPQQLFTGWQRDSITKYHGNLLHE